MLSFADDTETTRWLSLDNGVDVELYLSQGSLNNSTQKEQKTGFFKKRTSTLSVNKVTETDL